MLNFSRTGPARKTTPAAGLGDVSNLIADSEHLTPLKFGLELQVPEVLQL